MSPTGAGVLAGDVPQPPALELLDSEGSSMVMTPGTSVPLASAPVSIAGAAWHCPPEQVCPAGQPGAQKPPQPLSPHPLPVQSGSQPHAPQSSGQKMQSSPK